jgi:hypothetical protein
MATAPKAAGIMDLPENEDMNQAPQLSPMESYDAVTTALNTASPDAAAQYEQTMNMSLPPELMEMSAEEISQLLQLFQFLQENPDQYEAVVADLIKTGVLDEGDLPPEYDEEVVATVSALLMQALKTKQGSMAQEPQGFAMGGIADAARAVANSGRGKDTLLAHITPAEAAMLRKQGGMGTINPVTGLREYGFFSDIFKGVGKAVKSVVKGVVNVAKKIVASPIGRIVATVALTAFLGPAAASIGFSTAATAAAVSGGLTAISGGSLKDVLISSATAYFGAPGGPVSNFVGGLGISSVGAQAALASGISGTAAGLMQGQNLRDSLKGGLTQAAIGAGTAIGANYMSQPPGTRSLDAAIKNVFTPADALGDQIGGKVYPPSEEPFTVNDALSGKTPEVINRSTPRLEGGAPIKTAAELMPITNAPKALSVDAGGGLRVDAGGGLRVDAGGGLPVAESTPVTNPTLGGSVNANYALASDNPAGMGMRATSPAVQAAQVGQTAPAPYSGPPTVMDSLKTMGSGIMDIGQGNFGQGFDQLASGAGDLFMPSGPTPEQIQAGKLDAFSSAKTSALARGMTEPEAVAFAKNALESYTPPDPGIMRTYGPATVAGIAGLGAMGGFEQGENQESGLAKTIKGTPGLDLIKADPRRYLVQNMYGINYTPEGAFNEANLYAQPVQRRAGGGIMAIGGYANGGEVNLAEQLTPQSTPEQIMAAYKQFLGTTGQHLEFLGRSSGDTQEAQGVAVNYLRDKGIQDATTQQAYQLYQNPAPVLTAEIAKDLMHRSMTTGAPTSEFDKYGGYDAVNALYQQGGGKYDYSGISPTQLNQLAQTVANTGVGNMRVLKDTNTPLTAAGLDYIQGMPGGGMSIADLSLAASPSSGMPRTPVALILVALILVALILVALILAALILAALILAALILAALTPAEQTPAEQTPAEQT